MSKSARALVWVGVTAAVLSVATIAIHRGEEINAMWLVVAAVCSYALGYRFYSKFIAARVLTLDALRATPAERLENGRDFVRTNKWVVFGHHFAADGRSTSAAGTPLRSAASTDRTPYS